MLENLTGELKNSAKVKRKKVEVKSPTFVKHKQPKLIARFPALRASRSIQTQVL